MTDNYAERLAAYERLIATQPGIERKGKKNPYTSLNGNMFSFLARDGTICLRLPVEQRETFVAQFNTPPVEQYGAVMKEYVAVPPALLANEAQLAECFATSVAYAKSLKPKPTKRKTNQPE